MPTKRIPDSDIPSADFQLDFEPGSIKAVKSNARRCDAVSFIPIDEIVEIQGFNVRLHSEEYKARIRSIADSILADGFRTDRVLTAIVRRGRGGADEVALTDGYTRLAAVKLANDQGAGITELPVFLRAKGTSMSDITADLVRANSGRPLSLFETAIVAKRLAAMEHTAEEIAQKLDVTTTSVENMLLLAAAPNPLVRMIMDDAVSCSVVIDMLRKHGPAKAVEILKAAGQKASTEGKTRVLPKHMPGAAHRKALNRAAAPMFQRITDIRADPGFAGLSPENRAAIEVLLEGIPEDDAVSGSA